MLISALIVFAVLLSGVTAWPSWPGIRSAPSRPDSTQSPRGYNPPSLPPNPAPSTFFDNVTIWSPPATWPRRSGSYGRSVLLNKNCERATPTILATAAYSPPDGEYLQIFESKDLGKTWSMISKAHFNGNSSLTGGIILQPFLFELAQPYGKYPAGTIMLSGNRIPADHSSTNIELYASPDQGHTWSFVSTIVSSGPPNTANGAPCVWEPFLLAHEGHFAVYFSDQSDPRYGQKLSHRTSTNLHAWSQTLDDITNSNSTLRPGMFTTAQMGARGPWIATFEMGLWNDATAPYATHYRIASSPFSFLHAKEYQLRTNTGSSSAGPYVVGTPAGGAKGTVVVSDSSYDQLFLSTDFGRPGSWRNVSSGHGVGYTRSLMVLPGDGGRVVQVLNGGRYSANETMISVGDFLVPGGKGAGRGTDGFAECGR